MVTLPASFAKASWRNTTRYNVEDDTIGMGFNLDDGNVIRLALNSESANHLAETIMECLVLSNPKYRQRFQEWMCHSLQVCQCDHQPNHQPPVVE